MGRLNRFDEHRYVGTRDDMVVYDCDNDVALATLKRRMADDKLLHHNLVQTFGPDSLAEARNRGFKSS